MATDVETAIKNLHNVRRYLEDKEWSDKNAGPHIDVVNDVISLLKKQDQATDNVKSKDIKTVDSLFNITDKITLSVDETIDGFIFSCIKPWIEYHTNYHFIVSKPLLIRALTEFRKNNPEEFYRLSEPMKHKYKRGENNA